MRVELTDEQAMVRAMAAEFAQEHVAPIASEIDRDARFPHETVKRMGELGLLGIMVPEQWGGSGADTISYVVNLPGHVNILDLILVPAAQRSVHLVDRK